MSHKRTCMLKHKHALTNSDKSTISCFFFIPPTLSFSGTVHVISATHFVYMHHAKICEVTDKILSVRYGLLSIFYSFLRWNVSSIATVQTRF